MQQAVCTHSDALRRTHSLHGSGVVDSEEASSRRPILRRMESHIRDVQSIVSFQAWQNQCGSLRLRQSAESFLRNTCLATACRTASKYA